MRIFVRNEFVGKIYW